MTLKIFFYRQLSYTDLACQDGRYLSQRCWKMCGSSGTAVYDGKVLAIHELSIGTIANIRDHVVLHHNHHL